MPPTRWNTTADFSIELTVDEGIVWDDGNEVPAPQWLHELSLLGLFICLDDAELNIEFTSEGYEDPGCTYGPPENCYPPEGEDERLLSEATINGIVLPPKLSQELFDLYEEKIMDVEIDTEPDYYED